jgi:uncharacterized protein YkwD
MHQGAVPATLFLVMTTLGVACARAPRVPIAPAAPPQRQTAAPPAAGPAARGGSQEPADRVVADFVRLANDARQRAQCPPLLWDSRLAQVAARHSADMSDRRYFSHDNPDGLDPFERLKAAGIGFHGAAENLLQGATTGARALELWLSSPGHRSNLLDCSLTHHGVGRFDTYWTHVFIRP